MKSKFSLVLTLICLAGAARAELYYFQGITIDVPKGFDGPIESKPNALSEAVGFTVPGIVGSPPNTLQMVRMQLPAMLPPMNDDERFQVLTMHLTKMLKALEARRTSYSQTAIERVRLGGLLAARATWSGNAQAFPMSGVFYCVLIDTGVFFLQASGPGEKPDQHQVQAIEALKALHHGG